MYDLQTNTIWLSDELLDELKLFERFYGGESVKVDVFETDKLRVAVTVNGKIFPYETELPYGEALEVKRIYKRFAKHSLYTALSAYYGVELPWGSLTGIRPTKLAYAYIAHGGTKENVADYLKKTFGVSDEKARLIKRIIDVREVIPSDTENYANLYVHIPFCDGRCNYCSFPSADINAKGAGELVDKYVDVLCRDIKETLKMIGRSGKRILSVYFGGGTPSVLSPLQIEKLLSAVNVRGIEFTFEAGRADSVDIGKLDAMRAGGVTRVCINPQTLNEKTLLAIGRRHTVRQFYEAYELAYKKGFIINTDIIAGLSGETFEDFRKTADGIHSLAPQNITLHTLSRKRASLLAFGKTDCEDISSMMEYAYDKFSDYEPYYLYRQKYMTGNLENTGFCKKDCVCVNNVTVMEELVSVYACGAGSISKRIDGVITRYAMPKDVKLYIGEADERIAAKAAFFGV